MYQKYKYSIKLPSSQLIKYAKEQNQPQLFLQE